MWDNTEYDNDIIDDDYSDNEEFISEDYNDLVEHIKLFNKDNNSIDINQLKSIIDECSNIMESKSFELDNICENIWNDVIEPFIDNQASMILKNDKYRIKNNFFQWMKKKTNIGKKINYTEKLVIDFSNKSEILKNND